MECIALPQTSKSLYYDHDQHGWAGITTAASSAMPSILVLHLLYAEISESKPITTQWAIKSQCPLLDEINFILQDQYRQKELQ